MNQPCFNLLLNFELTLAHLVFYLLCEIPMTKVVYSRGWNSSRRTFIWSSHLLLFFNKCMDWAKNTRTRLCWLQNLNLPSLMTLTWIHTLFSTSLSLRGPLFLNIEGDQFFMSHHMIFINRIRSWLRKLLKNFPLRLPTLNFAFQCRYHLPLRVRCPARFSKAFTRLIRLLAVLVLILIWIVGPQVFFE